MAEPPTQQSALAKRPLPKRFYRHAEAVSCDGGFMLHLDGKPARTPLKHPLMVPEQSLADTLAAEWTAQTGVIDPATMPLTRLVITAIDAVTGREEAVRDDIVKYAGSDLLCYRADGPDTLVARQAAAWDPVLTWASRTLGAPFVVTHGLIHMSQSPAITPKFAALLDGLPPLELAALHTMTTLTGSALLAFALARAHLPLEQVWHAAHIDEDWQAEQWGRDKEAEARRAYRWQEAQAAAMVLAAHHRS